MKNIKIEKHEDAIIDFGNLQIRLTLIDGKETATIITNAHKDCLLVMPLHNNSIVIRSDKNISR